MIGVEELCGALNVGVENTSEDLASFGWVLNAWYPPFAVVEDAITGATLLIGLCDVCPEITVLVSLLVAIAV